MTINRKVFLKRSLKGIMLIGFGNSFQFFTEPFELPSRKDVTHRFAIVSDGHYGQIGTEYEFHHDNMIEWLNQDYLDRGLDFTMINGDLFHNDVEFLQDVKQRWDNLQMPHYVSHGNHDMTDEATWKKAWNTPFNYSFELGDAAFIVLNTASDKGEYICPDLSWTNTALQQYAAQKHLFVFMHITPFKWTNGGIPCKDIVSMFTKQNNLRAIFHGHDHDQDGVKKNEGKLYFFDSHVAGNWGTEYNGYRIVEILADGTILTYQMNAARKHRVNHNEIK